VWDWAAAKVEHLVVRKDYCLELMMVLH